MKRKKIEINAKPGGKMAAAKSKISNGGKKISGSNASKGKSNRWRENGGGIGKMKNNQSTKENGNDDGEAAIIGHLSMKIGEESAGGEASASAI